LYTGKAALFDTTDETFEEITERRKTQSGETAASSDDAAASKKVWCHHDHAGSLAWQKK
jgi:hypothetical protein